MQCFPPDGYFYYAEVTDSGIYYVPCRNGHLTATLLQEQKFTTLYELALHAILDGYYREAAVTFSSSLESFYEFYLKVVARKKKTSNDKFDAAWKIIAKQSERQLGAYILTYTFEKGFPPPTLHQKKKIEFRNDVVHHGKIPTRQEAEEYGQTILDVILPVLTQLRTEEQEHVSSVGLERLLAMQRSIPPDQKIATMARGTTVLNLTRPLSEPQPTLIQALSELEERRKRWGLK